MKKIIKRDGRCIIDEDGDGKVGRWTYRISIPVMGGESDEVLLEHAARAFWRMLNGKDLVGSRILRCYQITNEPDAPEERKNPIWNRITGDPASLPEPGKHVVLAWEFSGKHGDEPHVEPETYRLEWEPNGDLYLWAHHSGDANLDILDDDDNPSHWMFFPDPPTPEEK